MKRCVFSFCLLIYGILILNVAWASPECERLAKDDNESRQVVKVCTELINNSSFALWNTQRNLVTDRQSRKEVLPQG